MFRPIVQLLMCTCYLLRKNLVIYPIGNEFRKIISFLAKATIFGSEGLHFKMMAKC